MIAAALFILPQVLLDLGSFTFDIYFRLFLNFLWGFLFCALCIWVVFAPMRYMYKPHIEIDRKRIIWSWVFRAIGLILFIGSFYFLLVSVVIGSYHLLVIKQPIEVVTDKVVFLSSSGRYATSNQSCIFIICSFELKNDPSRNLNYNYPSDIQINGTYTFFVLPDSDIVLMAEQASSTSF